MTAYYTIALIALLAAISPGPDFVVIANYAIAHNRTQAILASLGIFAGILIHTTYCVLGLALVIQHSILLLNLIKYLGAAYLIYLGMKNLIGKNHRSTKHQNIQLNVSSWSAFRDGLLTNVLNPKCTLFMLSIFTLVIKPHTQTLIQASYGVEIALITLAWFICISYGLTMPTIQSKLIHVQHIVTKLIGSVLIALGITAIFELR